MWIYIQKCVKAFRTICFNVKAIQAVENKIRLHMNHLTIWMRFLFANTQTVTWMSLFKQLSYFLGVDITPYIYIYGIQNFIISESVKCDGCVYVWMVKYMLKLKYIHWLLFTYRIARGQCDSIVLNNTYNIYLFIYVRFTIVLICITYTYLC